MPLPTFNLDDRRFDDLVEEAKRQIATSCPSWTDLSPGDPGIVLLEVFAHLTEVMLYRLNRLPDKAYVEFLNLLGVQLRPPSAAAADLEFTLSRAAERPLEIRKGTRVTVARAAGAGEPPVFTTAHTLTIESGGTAGRVRAYHADFVEGELAGYGTGLPGAAVAAQRPPLVRPVVTREGVDLELVVAVEATPEELDPRVTAVRFGEKTYRVWREVPNFSGVGRRDEVYVVDRATGHVGFAPAVRLAGPDGQLAEVPQPLAAVPPARREIRLWYWTGGGAAGNVAEGTLTTIKELRAPASGLSVTNPDRAWGGQDGEPLENAMRRGPHEFHSLQRAITAGDFESMALASGAVARARAFTRATLWRHAAPGTVEVVLVPRLPDDVPAGQPLPAPRLEALQAEDARLDIQTRLDERRPLGTECRVSWARYKTVRVQARVVAYREEDLAALRARLLERLYRTLTPLNSMWRFGQALRASHVYDIVLGEPGVNYVDGVRLLLDDLPDRDITCLAADAHQPRTWYAGMGDTLFRSLDDGDGWEIAGRFPGERIDAVAAHPGVPGWVAIATAPTEGEGERGAVRVSGDCGETWPIRREAAFAVADVAWLQRADGPVVLAATSVGLYELAASAEASLVQVAVDPDDPGRGFYAVATWTDARGAQGVAVASRGEGGVFVSTARGRAGTFRHAGLDKSDVRTLGVEQDGPRTFLWGGFTAAGGDAGSGAARLEIIGTETAASGWERFSKGWSDASRPPGSCHRLAFGDDVVYAGSHQAGVLRLDLTQAEPVWELPDIDSGLPHRELGRIFHRVKGLATSRESGLVLAGGPAGVHRSRDGARHFEAAAGHDPGDQRVTLPQTWLFCSGEHDVTVTSDDAIHTR